MIYISGKITGDENYIQKFAKAEKKLNELGYLSLNPARECMKLGITDNYDDCMVYCLGALEKCDAIYMLTDWESSNGANIELLASKKLDLEIIYE